MRGFLLAAGRGIRMQPLTRLCAKAALPLLNRPMFHHGLELLRAWGCSEGVMNLHHLPDSILSHLEEWTPEGFHLETQHEPILLGTAGGLKRAEAFLGAGSFWILNADSLPVLDPRAMMETHRREGALVTLALRPHRTGAGYAPVEIDGKGRIVRINGKPEGSPRGDPHTFIGAQFAEPDLLRSIPADHPSESTSEVYLDLLRRGAPLVGFLAGGGWVELGNPRAYAGWSLSLLGSGRGIDPVRFRPFGAGRFLEGDHGAEDRGIHGPLLMGRGVRIGKGAAVDGGAVIGRNVEIAEGARVCRSILWENSRIGAGANLFDCIVAGAVVEPGVQCRGEILLPLGPTTQMEKIPSGPAPSGDGWE